MNRIWVFFIFFLILWPLYGVSQQSDTIPQIIKPQEEPSNQIISDQNLMDTTIVTQNEVMEKSLADSTQIDSAAYEKTKQFLQELLQQAETEVKQEQKLDLDLGLEDLIVDQTLTKPGRDFYDYFNSEWRLLGWPDVEGDYIITLSERPFRLRTTQIVVTLNDLTVYEGFLQPRDEYLEQLAKALVDRTQAYIFNYDRIQQDLSSNDLTGSGIY